MTFRPVAVSSQMLVTTSLALLLLFGLGILFLVLQHQLRDKASVHYTFLCVGCIMLLLAIASFGLRIRSYGINSGNLVVNLGFSKKIFPLSGLQSASLMKRPFSGARKDMGSAGVWSYYGSFSSANLGAFSAYATTGARGVLLVWPDKKVLVTPDDAERFIQSAKTGQ